MKFIQNSETLFTSEILEKVTFTCNHIKKSGSVIITCYHIQKSGSVTFTYYHIQKSGSVIFTYNHIQKSGDYCKQFIAWLIQEHEIHYPLMRRAINIPSLLNK